MDPFALPCHPSLAVSPGDRDWRAIGVRSSDDVTRKQTRCPECATSWTAYRRAFGDDVTVEWLRPVPFRVFAAPLPDAPRHPVWQDAAEPPSEAAAPAQDRARALRDLQEQTAGLGDGWARSAQLVTPVVPLVSAGQVLAEPGTLLLERREKWNGQDRRLALLWAPAARRQVVAWHGVARLLQE